MKKLILVLLLCGCTQQPQGTKSFGVDPYTVECIDHELYIVSIHGKYKLEGGCDD